MTNEQLAHFFKTAAAEKTNFCACGIKCGASLLPRHDDGEGFGHRH